MFIGCLNFIFGLLCFSVSLGFTPAFFRSDLGFVTAFFLFGLSLIPFIATYGKLGLGQEGAGAEEGERKGKELTKHVPSWDWMFLAVLIAFGVAVLFRTVIHPFYVLMGSGSWLSAYWFLHVYPVAKSVLKEDPGEPNQ